MIAQVKQYEISYSRNRAAFTPILKQAFDDLYITSHNARQFMVRILDQVFLIHCCLVRCSILKGESLTMA
jgi:hypothetical protein